MRNNHEKIRILRNFSPSGNWNFTDNKLDG